MTWWITFHDGSAACFELEPSKQPERISPEEYSEMTPAERTEYRETWDAELLVRIDSEVSNLRLNKQVTSIQPLPYPAMPRIGTWRSGCPSFCMSPKQCAGRSSCPRSYACTE
jgi:hypothetical protein